MFQQVSKLLTITVGEHSGAMIEISLQGITLIAEVRIESCRLIFDKLIFKKITV